MGKLEVLGNVLKAYLLSKNEWFINYKLSLYLFIVGLFTFSLYGLFGNYSLFFILYKLVVLLTFGHIIVSVVAVINDYVFDVNMKAWFKILWLLLSFRVFLEVFLL